MASFGNDSCALIQWAYEEGLDDVTVLYNHTGWAAPEWAQRVDELSEWVKFIGFKFAQTESEGFAALAERKMAFPRDGMQFCTECLKGIPTLAWLDIFDPEGDAVIHVGVRREESVRRRNFPEWVEESEFHGGRSVHAPLVRHTEQQRNELLGMAQLAPLPHRSKECDPCVNAGRYDLREVSEEKIVIIENLETKMGVGKVSGKPKTMYRPGKHMGAVGIREVIKWANGSPGQYAPGQEDLLGSGCDGGYCE